MKLEEETKSRYEEVINWYILQIHEMKYKNYFIDANSLIHNYITEINILYNLHYEEEKNTF